jgi:NMD protein affecting ribosome stability and mRNA decay
MKRPPQPTRHCADCGIRFQPREAWHRLCGKCYAWARAPELIGQLKRLLDYSKGSRR